MQERKLSCSPFKPVAIVRHLAERELAMPDNFISRGRIGYQQPQLMDSDDEQRLVARTERRVDKVNAEQVDQRGRSLQHGYQAQLRLNRLFGVGGGTTGSIHPAQARRDVDLLAVALAPDNRHKLLYRGTAFTEADAERIKDAFLFSQEHPDAAGELANASAAYVLLHGNGTPPSISSVESIAKEYAKLSDSWPNHTRVAHITIEARGRSGAMADGQPEIPGTLGATASRHAYRSCHEIKLSDRNTYRIAHIREGVETGDLHIHVVATGQTDLGEEARAVANDRREPRWHGQFLDQD